MASKERPELAQSDVIDALPRACVDEVAAREFVENQRWGDAPVCVHCGDVNVYRMKGASAERRGLLRCHGCKKQFTVRVGTIFEDSKLPLSQWCRAFWEASTCKNGISALELSRKLQITYRSALFMLNRIRHAMTRDENPPKLTGTIEADEMYWGGKARHPRIVRGAARGGPNPDKPKTPIFAVVERGGEVRASVMPTVNGNNVREALLNMAEPSCRLITDELKAYRRIGRPFAKHDTVNHTRDEYVNKDDPSIHTNTVESFFARVRRQLRGTYHNVSKQHLHRYVAQAAYMYNARTLNDGERITKLFKDSEGKRLMYKRPA